MTASFVVLHIPRSPRGDHEEGNLGRHIASLLPGASLQLDCIWLVQSEGMADEVRDRLSAVLPPEDALVVLSIGDQAAWSGLTDEQEDWLVGHV